MTPLERVARAICEAFGSDPDARSFAFDEREAAHWELWIAEARAAIDAMKSPSKVQIKAGANVRACIVSNAEEIAAMIYADMIDAALKEK